MTEATSDWKTACFRRITSAVHFIAWHKPTADPSRQIGVVKEVSWALLWKNDPAAILETIATASNDPKPVDMV